MSVFFLIKTSNAPTNNYMPIIPGCVNGHSESPLQIHALCNVTLKSLPLEMGVCFPCSLNLDRPLRRVLTNSTRQNDVKVPAEPAGGAPGPHRAEKNHASWSSRSAYSPAKISRAVHA